MADRVERRESSRSVQSEQSGGSSNVNVFSDQFAVDGAPVADGFRPTESGPSREPTPRPSTPPRIAKPSVDESKTEAARRIAALSGSSSAARNSFTLLNDASDPPSRIPSMHQSDISRRISTISSTSTAIPRTQSPFTGATAPSHPYGMYPQDTQLNRSSTVSTIRPSRPAHPYGMYSQGTAGETAGEAEPNSEAAAGVGFPGLNQPYARRLGPDGEEADDIIGPDGHTEQLPPYTRYPDGIPPKERTISAIEEASPSSPESASQPPFPGGASSDQGTLGGGGGSGESESATVVASEAGPIKEKETWKEISKRRTCFGRLPVWVLAVIIAIIIVGAAVIGGAIGANIGKKEDKNAESDSMNESDHKGPPGPAETLSDARPLTATPANLEPLPTGNFILPMSDPLSTDSFCLSSDYNSLWKCLPKSLLYIDVEHVDDQYDTIQLGDANPDHDKSRTYGAQPPVLDRPTPMELMLDISNPDLGPAYYFCDHYDKLVVFPENDPAIEQVLQQGGPSKRYTVSEDELFSRELDVALQERPQQPGDKPWFCWWNQTYLEGFIYVTEQSNANITNITTILREYPDINNFGKRGDGDGDGDDLEDPSDDYDDDDDGEYPESTSAPPLTPTAVAATSPGPSTAATSAITPTSAAQSPVQTSESPKSSGAWPDAPDWAFKPKIYEKVVKIAERRHLEDEYPTYCEQKEIMKDGTLAPVQGASPIKITQASEGPKMKLKRGEFGRGFGGSSFRRPPPSGRNLDFGDTCSCEWRSH